MQPCWCSAANLPHINFRGYIPCSRVEVYLFECFPEYDKEHKWRLGLTIVAAVLTHSSSILAGAIMIGFWNETLRKEEGDSIEQDGGSSHEELDNRSEAHPSNVSEAQQVKWTIMYKTGLGIATVTLTGCFYRKAQFPVVRCICAHSAVVTILRVSRKVARWWRERAQAPQRNGMMFAVVVENLNAIVMERRWGICVASDRNRHPSLSKGMLKTRLQAEAEM